MWKLLPVLYSNEIVLDLTQAPFDGKPVLIKTSTGIVEAWWDNGSTWYDHEGALCGDGYCWVCYDDQFQLELSEAEYWMELPKEEYQSRNSKEFLSIEANLMVIDAKETTKIFDKFFSTKKLHKA